MGKSKYNKKTEMWERLIKLNGTSTLIGSTDKKSLENIPYRIGEFGIENKKQHDALTTLNEKGGKQ